MTFVSKSARNPLVIVIAIMIVYVGFALYVDIGKLSKSVLNINYATVPLILVPMTLHIFLLGVRFHRFLRVLNINISIKQSILIYTAGLSLMVTPASFGQVIKSQIIKKQFGYSISKTSPIVLIEKWNELTSVIIILVIFTIITFIIESAVIITLGSVIALVLFCAMKNQHLFIFLRKIIIRFQRLKVFEERIENSRDTLKILSCRSAVLDGAILTIPAAILQALSVFFAFQALGINVGFVLSTQIFYIALISGILSFVPGGFGVTEGSMLALLIKYYNNDLALLAASVIFVRLVTLWYPTFLGIITSQFILKYRGILNP